MEKKYSSREVFTPTKPARIAFVERNEVNDKLVSALRTPGKQVVVYGHSGTGKTTLLLNKLQQLYERHITSRCMKGMKFDQLVLDAFDQLAPFYTSEFSSSQKRSISVDIGSSYKLLSAKIASSATTEASDKSIRVLPPQLTPQALGKFLGEAGACWVIEDFHKTEGGEKERLAQLMKVFMDMSDDYPDLKIVALGAVDTARQVVECDPEMKNRVAEIHVPLMTEHEIKQIVLKGEAALNIKFSPNITGIIAKHCNGLASVCHHLCLNMCDAADINMVVPGAAYHLTNEHCEVALKTYVDEASDSLKGAFEKALRPRRSAENNAEIVIKALVYFKEDGAARFNIHKRIKESRPNYPDHRLKFTLGKLCEPSYGSVIRFDQNSSKYSFSDPIYRTYALARYQEKPSQKTRIPDAVPLQDFERLLLSLVREKMKMASLQDA